MIEALRLVLCGRLTCLQPGWRPRLSHRLPTLYAHTPARFLACHATRVRARKRGCAQARCWAKAAPVPRMEDQIRDCQAMYVQVLDEDGDPQLVAIKGRQDCDYEPELLLCLTQLRNYEIIDYWDGLIPPSPPPPLLSRCQPPRTHLLCHAASVPPRALA